MTELAIKEGRSGDFIEDRNGKKISLTALMFVRHHKAFDFADYIQINQFKPGKATLYITMKSYLGRVGQTCSPKMDTRFDSGFPASFFDLSNIAIDFDFKIISKPIRTAMGKLKLRV